jgi:putative methionine-R-sulfoxide reductase with GAF domain
MLKPTARETIEQLKTMVELSAVLNSTLDQTEVRRRAMEAVKELVGCEASSLLLVDEKSGELYFEVALGKKGEKVKEIRLKIGEGIAGWVASTGEPALVHDVTRDPRHARKVDEHSHFSTRNMVCVPVKVREKVIGVLQGINKIRGVFYKQDLEIMQMLANQVGIAIDHARLYEAIHETFLENAEANKMLGLTFQSKGMLELAFERYMKVPLDGEMMEVLYHLGFDFERMRMFQKAKEVYEMIAAKDSSFRDVRDRLKLLGDASQSLSLRTSRIVIPSSRGRGSQRQGLGQTLGRYEVLEEIGRGSLGRVYKGRDPRIQRLVALKVLEWEEEIAPEEQAELTQLFLKEVEIAGRLNHPGIVVIFDAGEELGLPYVAMEFLEGMPLDRWLEKGKITPISHVWHIANQICKALVYAHGQGTLHGGIKASNAFLLSKGRVKITDFGTANILSRMQGPLEGSQVSASTPYLPPEAILGEPLDERSDLYSLGVLLYALLAGRLPFSGEDPNALMEQIIIKRATPLRQIRPEVPVELGDLVERLLSKEPEARYASAKELEEALQGLPRDWMEQRAGSG